MCDIPWPPPIKGSQNARRIESRGERRRGKREERGERREEREEHTCEVRRRDSSDISDKLLRRNTVSVSECLAADVFEEDRPRLEVHQEGGGELRSTKREG